MAKPHKYEFANIQLNTRITTESLQQLVKDLTASQKSLRLRSDEGNHLYFFVKNLFGGSTLDFTVTISDHGDYRALSTEITDALISQQTLLFIPISPKEMVGYSAYRKFMTGLAEAAKTADQQAQALITERHN